MTVQERILALQLLEMIKNNPSYTNKIGVEGRMVTKEKNKNDR